MGENGTTAPGPLPHGPRLFVDRAPEFESQDRALAGALARGVPMLSVISGMPGVGKTTLMVKWARHVRDQFPDGQLYLELGGSTEPGEVPPADLVRDALVQLGVDTDRVPSQEHERVARYRSLTAGKSFLLVLDDAATAAQVMALLPSSSSCAVVVTSRRWLDHPAWSYVDRIELEPLADEYAATLLREASGIDLSTEAAAVESLLAACAGLPLAIEIAAGQLRRPRRRISEVVENILAGKQAAGSIEAVLDVAYLDLPPELARTYRLLALHPGPHFGVPAAAAMLDLPEAEARARLDELADVYLLSALGPDRYRFHLLVSGHAKDRCLADSMASDCDGVRGRAVAWYSDHAISLARAYSQRWWAHPDRFTRTAPAFTGPDAAARAQHGFETEHLNFLAILLQADTAKKHADVLLLGDALWPWLYNTDRVADLELVQRTALDVTETADNRIALMRMRNQFGTALEKRSAFAEAKQELRTSLATARELDHVLGQQTNLEWLGIVLEQEGDLDGALAHLEASAEMAARIDEPQQAERSIALGSMHTARVLAALHRDDEALLLSQKALVYFTEHRDDVNKARCYHQLSKVHHALARGDIARPLAEQAVTIAAGAGLRSLHIAALRTLSDIEEALGDHDTAARLRAQADELSESD